ncbi:MAG: hypothetical protein ACREXK_01660 [Gammaproteobacteria bacterium]
MRHRQKTRAGRASYGKRKQTVGLVATLLAVRRGAIPPTINLRVPDPDCDLDYVRDRGRDGVDIGLALSNSFAFGGTNAVLVARATD